MMSKLRHQLVALAAIAIAGSTFIGAHYAHVGRLFGRGGYTVTVHLADSGGIFSGADATYRGVSIGRVRTMTLSAGGVDAQVEVDRSTRIPTDTLVVVADKSAVGEQYLDFQPRTDSGPFLRDGSEISQESTRIPVRTDTLLTNLNGLVASVPAEDLRVVIDQLGLAFVDTAPKLRRIISTSMSFLSTAQENFEVTAQLIKDSRTVLQTQVSSGHDISSFVSDLDRFSQALRGSDSDLRTVLDTGSSTADTLRDVIAENAADLGRLVDHMVTTNRVVKGHLPGIRGVLVLAPYGIEGAYSILAKDPQTGRYRARFSLAMQPDPSICTTGRRVRTPFDTAAGASADAPCTRAAGATGAQRVIGTYDERSKTVTPYAAGASVNDVDASDLGSESWKWAVLGPAATK